MGRRWLMGLGLVLMVLLALPQRVGAGGWSVVTLDSTPTNIQAGVPFKIGFMVRQHGVRPMEGLHPEITMVDSVTKAKVTAVAQAEGEVGHYVATLTLPSAGNWDWTIDAYGPVATLSPLQVQAAPAVATTSVTQWATGFVPVLAVVVVFTLVALSAIAYIRRRRLVTQA